MLPNLTRIDLHVHTRYSGVCDIWPLSEFEILESHTTPRQVYELAKSRDMDYVTITDHDTIDGALELAHLDDFLIGEEVSALFPEDGAKIHVVTIHINETQHREIQDLRTNVYELAEYLRYEEIFHFVAYPLYKMTDLSLKHFEKMLLLFTAFEVKNGGKHLDPANLLEDLLNRLSPETMWKLAKKHEITPHGDSPWRKTPVAGSDDHGGIQIGSPHTVTPFASSREALVAFLKRGESRAEGTEGTPFSVAHQILSVGYKQLRGNRHGLGDTKSRLGIRILSPVFQRNTTGRFWARAAASASLLFEALPKINDGGRSSNSLSTLRRNLVSRLFRDRRTRRYFTKGFDFSRGDDEELYRTLREVITGFVYQADRSNGSEPLDILRRYFVALPVFIPYLIACRAESRSRPFISEVKRTFMEEFESEQLAVFSDSPSELRAHGFTFQRLLSEHSITPSQVSIFDPSSVELRPFLRIPNAPPFGHNLLIPPIHSIIDIFAKQSFDRLYVNSLGPIGLLGFLSGILLRIPISCRFPYHTVNSLLSAENNRISPAVTKAALKTIFSLADQVRVHSEPALSLAMSLEIETKRLHSVDIDYLGATPGSMPSLDEIILSGSAFVG